MALPQMMQDVWDNHLSELTPMMKMYLETKKQNDDCIIFYRLGDFYEMFFDDAITASKTMEITPVSYTHLDVYKRQATVP